MVQVKTSELSGAALDWSVAQCLMMCEDYRNRGLLVHRVGYGQPMPNFSTDWAQGGPIIDALRPTVSDEGSGFVCSLSKPVEVAYTTGTAKRFCTMRGETYLLAVMRCFVASKLGDVVDVPKEIL